MTRKQFAKAQQRARKNYQDESNKLAKAYFKARVPLKRNVVFETTRKPPKGCTNRFVVFIIKVQHFFEVSMFDVAAGIWWLDKDNNCVKWETLRGVDNPNSNTYTRSKNQTFVKPEKAE